MMINGTGVHNASCTATNRALDPQGAPASATSSETIKIDETPPEIQFEPTQPVDAYATDRRHLRRPVRSVRRHYRDPPRER